MLEENKDIKSIGFNSLGAAALEEILVQNGYKVSGDYSNLVNYTYANEKVSTLKNQVGDIYVSNYVESEHPARHNLETHFRDLEYQKQSDFNEYTVETSIQKTGQKFSEGSNFIKRIVPKFMSNPFRIKLAIFLSNKAKENEVIAFVENLKKNQALNSVFQISVEENVYRVASGDTMYKICKKLDVSEQELIETNPWLKNRYSKDKSFALIRPDEKLVLPANKGKTEIPVDKILDEVENSQSAKEHQSEAQQNGSQEEQPAVQKKPKEKSSESSKGSSETKGDKAGHWITTPEGNHVLIEDSMSPQSSGLFTLDPVGMAYSMGITNYTPESNDANNGWPEVVYCFGKSMRPKDPETERYLS